MNTTTLIGNVGRDPEIKTFDWGKVASFSLATTEKYKNRKDEMITDTDWHNIIFRGKQAEVIEKYVHKGDKIAVTGKIKYRSYEDKEGKTIYITEIIGERFEFCGSKQEKPQNKEGERQGKPPYESGYSDIDDLPQHVQDAEQSQDNSEPPF